MSVERFDGHFKAVEVASATARAAQSLAEGAEGTAQFAKQNAADTIYGDLTGHDGVLHDGDIADYFEAAQRLDGESKKKAAEAAETFAQLVAPSPNAEPVIAYFPRSSYTDPVAVVSKPGGIDFELTRNESYADMHDLHMSGRAGSSEASLFDGSSAYLPSSGPYAIHTSWRAMKDVIKTIDFGTAEIFTDPEAAIARRQSGPDSSPVMLLGEAAEYMLALDGRNMHHGGGRYDTEAIALSSLVRRALGTSPDEAMEADAKENQDAHKSHTSAIAAGYVTGLLVAEKRRDVTDIGRPVIFDRETLELIGMSDEDIDAAVLEGVGYAGSVLSKDDTHNIYWDRIKGKKTKIGEYFTDGLEKKLADLAYRAGATAIEGFDDGLVPLSAEDRKLAKFDELVGFANSNSQAFRRLVFGRPGQEAMFKDRQGHEVRHLLDHFSSRSPRFKA